ncbi:MAG: FprA family A-type flavoprotein [Elusimicrobiota bacterium]|jgi:flavorubredoxin|nr:FprA family A-type flavoprotein [Elusimicrobiota bacterium]
MKAVKVSQNVYWVGAVDWSLRDFHGCSTERGTTYNAYVILDEKVVLIDTVKALFYEEFKARLKDALGGRRIDIVISNHSEMDHSGALRQTIADFKPAKVYASALGVQHLKQQLGQDLPAEAIANGATISTGQDSLTFLESKMLHWPDSMVALLNKENILFSNDIFGMHYASGARFEEQERRENWIYEFKKYYANIILPYSKIVSAFLKQMEAAGIKPRIICPDHGLIWQESIPQIIQMYHDFAENKSKKKAVIVYDTMWGSTAKMASAIEDGLAGQGIETRQFFMHIDHRSNVAAELLDAGAIIMGSPVINIEVFPSLGDVGVYLRGLKKQGLLGACFGSYGWSDLALSKVEDLVKGLGAQLVAPVVKSKFAPDEAKLKECFDLGVLAGQKINERFK